MLIVRWKTVSKSKFPRYNDGVASIYREKEKRSNFAAKENVSVLDDMDFIAKLDFELSSKREQDLEFANQNGFSLSLKIRTRNLRTVDNKCKAVVDGYLYDVSYVDKSRDEMWLFLEGIRKIS